MSEEKFAALSSGLLARKGAAKPAMRRQGFINPQGDVTEDLGWNDMGFEGPKPVDSETEFHGEAPLPEVRRQQDQLTEGLQDDQDANGVIPEDGGFMPEHEPYKVDGHGGLTPMGQEDLDEEDEAEAEYEADAEAEIEAESEAINGEDTEIEDDETNGSAHGLSIYGRAPSNGETSDAQPRKKMQALPEPQPVKPAAAPEATKTVDRAADKVPAREKVAFTLRLDKDRHLKLRLASAVTNQSAQRLVTEALDRFLEEHPEVQALSGHAGGKTH
ncbi:hypothetical protein HFP51_03085 [Parasphingopyxis sp. CP4]|uniref:hypothetical protein n=1 Tax=Parasphingopyxis sp. CP4 TaxID=2724527 RepID=UPI0015A4C120|nr:hypothetical protein [Parasphingopyxis sp. CP4]QLC20702.1 hypothetical protein HFP51_03085 [Parasphingopyxis sp. CP4]